MKAISCLVYVLCLCGAFADPLIHFTHFADDRALCVDGSRSGYYLRRTQRPQEFADKWMIYLGGGAWCWNPQNCYERSSTFFGSSKGWVRNMTWDDSSVGALSANCSVNPAFCNFNLIWMNYCDGNSYSGMRWDPVVYNKTQLYFRGKYILNAMLDTMIAEGGATATDVVLSGGSAGGLAVFLHSDYVAEYLQERIATFQSFAAIPISGFFLNEPNIRENLIYNAHMREAFALHNASFGLPKACIEAMPSSEAWRCNFAEFVFPLSKVKTFVFNSKMDFWQLTCILNVMPLMSYADASFNDVINGNCSAVPGYSCLNWNGYSNCSATEMVPPLAYQSAFLDRVFSMPVFRARGNGAYLTACYTHCEALDSDSDFLNIIVNGVNMSRAVERWYRESVKSKLPSGDHFYDDCYWTDSAPYQCNPTCPQ